jgi:hypothetical protein
MFRNSFVILFSVEIKVLLMMMKQQLVVQQVNNLEVQLLVHQ